MLKRDPIARPIPYRPGRPVATLQDGRPFDWPVGGGHSLIAGTTGSAVSQGVLAAIVASFAHRHDVALLAIDLKRVEVAALRARCSPCGYRSSRRSWPACRGWSRRWTTDGSIMEA